jgi:hypothetical protein
LTEDNGNETARPAIPSPTNHGPGCHRWGRPGPGQVFLYRNRALIVEAVWQHRQPTSVDFLAIALDDPHPDVWKQALDGLVTLASPESRKVLELAKSRLAEEDAILRARIEEAIDQIDERFTRRL